MREQLQTQSPETPISSAELQDGVRLDLHAQSEHLLPYEQGVALGRAAAAAAEERRTRERVPTQFDYVSQVGEHLQHFRAWETQLRENDQDAVRQDFMQWQQEMNAHLKDEGISYETTQS